MLAQQYHANQVCFFTTAWMSMHDSIQTLLLDGMER